MSKIICLNPHCSAVFDDTDVDTKPIDYHPDIFHGASFVAEIKPVCPCCGNPEIANAFKCEDCGEYFPADERRYHPYDDRELCEKCFDKAEDEIDSPYHGITNMFEIFGAMTKLRGE